jgi:hypothetical protein
MWTDNITRIVRSINNTVKMLKPWVKLSCSPIGKYDDLSRYRSNGWNARRRVAQDAQLWLREGLMDQLYPMMYFQGNNFYPFAIDWQENSYGRTIVSGLGIYMLDPKEGRFQLPEIKRQLNVTRQIGMGHCYFRAKFLLDNIKGVLDYATWFDRHPALIPPMTWAQSTPPTAPTTLEISRSEMGDVEVGMVLGGEFDGEAGALVAGLFAADLWMVCHLRIIAVFCLCRCHVAIDDVRILAVGHNDHGRCGKDTIQSLTTINEHIASRGTHKELDARNAMWIELGEETGIVVGGTKEETVVHVALLSCEGEFFFQSLQRRSLRHGVGHIEIGGDASNGSGTALCVDVRLLRQTWLTEMYVVVDDAWEHKTTRSVDDLVIRRFGRMVSLYNLSDFFVFND